jgi:hypothetical protein
MTTRIDVDRESHTTDARLVALTQQTREDGQRVVGVFDPLTTIDVKDQNLRDGMVFYVYAARLDGNQLADDANLDVVFTANPGVNVCMDVIVQCGGDAEFEIYENVTQVTGGTLFVPLNRNRRSTIASSCGAVIQPSSVTANGVIFQEIIIGGSGGNAGGNAIDSADYILKPDTSYLFRLTNRSGQDRLAEIQLNWCEPT